MKDASKPKAMDSRESLHVASLGKANFSAAMSNVEEPLESNSFQLR